MRAGLRARGWGATVAFSALAAFIAAGSAEATPITYYFAGGQVTITATVSGNPVITPQNVALNGISVTVDESAGTLDSISLSTSSSGSVTISPAYNGYDTINIDFAMASATGGSISLVDPGPPKEYGFTIGPVNVTGQFDATGTSPPISNQPFGFVNPTASGSIFIDPVNGKLVLSGITLGEIQPTGAPDPLVIKGDFVFLGLVPEPSTALLVGAGLVALGARGRRA
jgi:hypothetical protein